jgi:RNA-directed DNA polymerase
MEELYVEGLASHDGPESCAGVREGAGEALAGVRAGEAIEPRNVDVRGADAVSLSGRQHRRQRQRELCRAARGAGKPETFDFLGFTHICAKTRAGRFQVRRITISKRMRAKLKEVKDQLKQRRHEPVPEQGRWLGSVVRGHMAYYAVPGNIRAVTAFRTQVTRHWRAALQSRSQRGYLNWNRMNRLATRWLPPARILHPYPDERFVVRTRGRSRVR